MNDALVTRRVACERTEAVHLPVVSLVWDTTEIDHETVLVENLVVGNPETDVPEIEVVRPRGRLDGASVERVRSAIAAATGPVIVDLDECVVTGAAVLAQLRAATSDSPREVCFVSRRVTCRLLLHRAGVAERAAVFERHEDALHAWTSERTGVGSGWAPSGGAPDAQAARSLR